MHPELAKLAHLQEVERQSTALTAQIAGHGRRVAARKAALTETLRQLDDNQKALAQESAARRRMESDTDDLRQKATRYKAQLEGVQSEGQAAALQHQIAFCKQEIDRIDEMEFASLMRTESLETHQRLLHETIANLEQALLQEQADARLAEARDRAQQAELAQERDAVRQSVDTTLLAEYDRIVSGHKLAVAEVEAQRCTICLMMVRPQRWNEIRAGEVHFCESCGRFLFYNPPVDLADAVHLPPASKKPAGLAQEAGQYPDAATAVGHDHPTRKD
ncbi:MAG: zinc ribbon domain-containing protein [Acidobacteriaceae bacterium]